MTDKILDIANKARSIATHLGSYNKQENDIDEPDCNILSNEVYIYRDENFKIYEHSVITTLDHYSVYDDFTVSIEYKGSRIFAAHCSNNNAANFTYIKGSWENELEELYKRSLVKQLEKYYKTAVQGLANYYLRNN